MEKGKFPTELVREQIKELPQETFPSGLSERHQQDRVDKEDD